MALLPFRIWRRTDLKPLNTTEKAAGWFAGGFWEGMDSLWVCGFPYKSQSLGGLQPQRNLKLEEGTQRGRVGNTSEEEQKPGGNEAGCGLKWVPRNTAAPGTQMLSSGRRQKRLLESRDVKVTHPRTPPALT